jgi:hypothetical protein
MIKQINPSPRDFLLCRGVLDENLALERVQRDGDSCAFSVCLLDFKTEREYLNRISFGNWQIGWLFEPYLAETTDPLFGWDRKT